MRRARGGNLIQGSLTHAWRFPILCGFGEIQGSPSLAPQKSASLAARHRRRLMLADGPCGTGAAVRERGFASSWPRKGARLLRFDPLSYAPRLLGKLASGRRRVDADERAAVRRIAVEACKAHLRNGALAERHVVARPVSVGALEAYPGPLF